MSAKIDVKLEETKAAVAAEKAYAAAAAGEVETKPVVTEPVAAKPANADVAFPAQPARAAANKVEAAAKAAPKKAALNKVAPKKATAKATVSKKAAKPVTAKKTVKAPAKTAARTNPLTKLKDQIMTTTKTTTEDFSAKIKDAVAEAQDRAKVAFDKSQAAFGDYNEFAKGNVEALVESTKILAAGFQDLGKDYVSNGKTVLETVTADVKQLAAVKSPADFFKLQGEILRRNFDAAVTTGSKTSEKVVKVANEAFAPIQNRVSLAIEKVKQAA